MSIFRELKSSINEGKRHQAFIPQGGFWDFAQ